MKSETVDYLVLSHFIPAIIYDDETGLTDDESIELSEFMSEAGSFAMNRPGYVSHHWIVADNAGFERCEISAYFGETETLQLVIMYESGERA